METARPFPKIAAVISGGAAEANNRIRAGEKLVAVQGQSVSGCSLDTIKEMISGPRGTKVALIILGENGHYECTLERGGGISSIPGTPILSAIQETEADEAAAFDTSSPEEDLARSCTDIRRDLREAIEKAMAEGYHSAFDTDSAAGSRSACSVSPMMPQGLDGDGEARCEEDCESASTASSEEPALVSEERPKRLGAMSMRAGAGLYSLAVGRVRTESSLGWMAAVAVAVVAASVIRKRG